MSLSAQVLLGLVIMLIGGGTVFFHLVEGWSWLDAYFFTVITLSTVGYGELVPAAPLGKIGTTIFIFVGLGVFAAAVHQFGQFTLHKRQQSHAHLLEQITRTQRPAPEDHPPRS